MINRLATELKRLRAVRGQSLRQVEKATGVSNAYLSQIERGDATKPTPDKLARLASFYLVPYEHLMELAGYLGSSVTGSTEAGSRNMVLSASISKTAKPSPLQDALMNTDLNHDELQMVADYVAFIKTRRKKQGKR